jgi:hypothetical protein
VGERQFAQGRGLSIHVARQSRRFRAPVIRAVRFDQVRRRRSRSAVTISTGASRRFETSLRRVGVWRGGVRPGIAVPAPFVWRRLSGAAVAPFPRPPHRTGHADLPHPVLGQDLTPSSTARRAQAGSGVGARSARRGARVDSSRPFAADFVLEAQPPAQPHRRVSIERSIRLADGSYRNVVRPSAQRAVHFAHQRCGLLP